MIEFLFGYVLGVVSVFAYVVWRLSKIRWL